MDVECIKVISNYGVASGHKDFARLSKPEHFGDAVSALKYSKYELIREIQERSAGFGLWFFAGATLAVNVEYHAGIIQGQRGGTASRRAVVGFALCCYRACFIVSSIWVLLESEGERNRCWLWKLLLVGRLQLGRSCR